MERRDVRRCLLRSTIVIVVTASGSCALSATAVAAPHGGSGKLTLDGRVGPLTFDRSTESDVVAFAGQPEVMARGSFSGANDPDYVVLGYGCQERTALGLIRVDMFDYCRTAFYINTWTHRLVSFHSSSRRYSMRGASPGMSTRTAERHIHSLAISGCGQGFFLEGPPRRHASFFGEVDGGRTAGRNFHLVGGHLTALNLESNRYPVGLLFC
jgi:hypothetical protein